MSGLKLMHIFKISSEIKQGTTSKVNRILFNRLLSLACAKVNKNLNVCFSKLPGANMVSFCRDGHIYHQDVASGYLITKLKICEVNVRNYIKVITALSDILLN